MKNWSNICNSLNLNCFCNIYLTILHIFPRKIRKFWCLLKVINVWFSVFLTVCIIIWCTTTWITLLTRTYFYWQAKQHITKNQTYIKTPQPNVANCMAGLPETEVMCCHIRQEKDLQIFRDISFLLHKRSLLLAANWLLF